jgi:hypothetical protein
MKIGILTFHDGINYGAYLQVYSLYHVLQNLGAEPEILNYKGFFHWRWEYRWLLWTKQPMRLVSNLKKLIGFKRCQKLLKQTKFTFRRTGLPHYDKVVVGSDEIWNYSVPHRDDIYFGVGLSAREKYAYAASFGSVKENAEIPEKLLNSLKTFKKISVRDENSMQLMRRNLPEKECIKVLDPTLLYDFDGKEIEPCEKDYILIYTTHNAIAESVQNEIIAFAKKRNKTLIAVGYHMSWCEKNFDTLTPFEWIGFFKCADMVITTMFHGTMFSIKYQKEFCTILEPYRVNKLKDLLIELGLESRLYDNARGLDGVFDALTDYVLVEERLKERKKISFDYIREIVESRH